MSVFKRNRRATAKQAAGRSRHAKRPPVEAVLPKPAWPPVPSPELADRDYRFPRVQLPATRPVHADRVLAELAEDDTQTTELPRVIDGLADHVVDQAPQPAEAPGLGPVRSGEDLDEATARFMGEHPVPSVPFLNATAAAATRVAEAVTEVLPELRAQQLGSTTVVLRVPTAPQPPAPPTAEKPMILPGLAHPERRAYRGHRVFTDFDDAFYVGLTAMLDQAHAEARALEAATDQADAALMAHLERALHAHSDGVVRFAADEYASQLAMVSRPQTARPAADSEPTGALPQRIRGASLFLFGENGQPVPAAVAL